VRGPNVDGGHGAQPALENQLTAVLTQEGSDPEDEVQGDISIN